MQSQLMERKLDPVFRAQLKGTTSAINEYNAYTQLKGTLVLNTETNHLHVLSGQADTSIELANTTDKFNINAITGLQEALNSKLGKTEKAESAKTADSVSWNNVQGKPNIPIKENVESISGIWTFTNGLVLSKNAILNATPGADNNITNIRWVKSYVDPKISTLESKKANTDWVNTQLNLKLNKTDKAASATIADTVKKITVANFGEPIDLGMIGG